MKKLWELFFSFFTIGIFTIGGGMAMLPLVHSTIVDKKGWMSDTEMVDCLAVAQSLPGAVIINAATYIGKKEKGIVGSLFATLGVVLPSFICIIILVSLLSYIGENEYINGFFKGALSAAAGLVAVSCWKMGKMVYKDPVDIIIMIIVFALVIFFKVNVVWIILGSIPFGFAMYNIRKKIDSRKGGSHE